MNQQYQTIVEEARRLAREMPAEMVETLAEAMAKVHGGDSHVIRNEALSAISHPEYRASATAFIDTWNVTASDVAPESVALALLTAASSQRAHRRGQSVELVWTGPETHAIPIRHTEQALLQVIGAAKERLTVVSYAVYDIPHVSRALVGAADRGVAIRIIVETPDRTAGQNAYDTIRALGNNVAERSTVYFWPMDQREKDDHGKSGILHVKCAVADGHWLFLSSANLTRYAFTVNMELGILVTGGDLPAQVEAHLDQLIAAGVLTRV